MTDFLIASAYFNKLNLPGKLGFHLSRYQYLVNASLAKENCRYAQKTKQLFEATGEKAVILKMDIDDHMRSLLEKI